MMMMMMMISYRRAARLLGDHPVGGSKWFSHAVLFSSIFYSQYKTETKIELGRH